MSVFFIEDGSGLPPAFLMEDLKECNKIPIYGTLDGEGFTKYKICNEMNNDTHLMLEIF